MLIVTPSDFSKKNEFIRILTHKINWHLIQPVVLQWHWWAVGLLGALFIAIETIEHSKSLTTQNFFYFGEMFLSILFLLIADFLIRMLINTMEDWATNVRKLEQKYALGMQLSKTQDVQEMATQIANYAHSLTPGSNVRVFTFDIFRDQLNLTAQVGADDTLQFQKKSRYSLEFCQTCMGNHQITGKLCDSCKLMRVTSANQNTSRYCLPLLRSNLPVGLLHVYSSSDANIAAQHIEALNNVSDEMASALGAALEKKARQDIALTQTIHNTQLEIARDLHDTIVQNVSFLRMRLEYLSEISPHTNDVSQSEIQPMLAVANESYDLLRGTLAVLQSDSSASLVNLLAGHAHMVSDRSNFKVDFESQGKPEILPSRIMRQLFFIFREALSNVEKHANAGQVWVEVTWAARGLILKITDDGSGFDLSSVEPGSHYGLKFMRERMEKLNGKFQIQSSAGAGTTIMLRLPYETL